MSLSIWTRCAASFKPRRIDASTWRVVESQHVISTRKLVDSDEEQALLEELIDRVKRPVPADPAFRGLHYLLFTPFRHPPLRHGSRFGTRGERGIWYGSLTLDTALAEVAYYRLLFLEATSADLGTLTVELTAFSIPVRTRMGADLTRPPFRAHEKTISSKVSYAESQKLGAEMRAAGVVAFLFVSARATRRGTNLGLFAPAFASKRPRRFETWVCSADRAKVEFATKSVIRRRPLRFGFARADFLVEGKLPSPAA